MYRCPMKQYEERTRKSDRQTDRELDKGLGIETKKQTGMTDRMAHRQRQTNSLV